MESWRPGLVQQILDYLRDGVSVNVVGLSGSGRSQMARIVADHLRRTVFVSGVRAFRDRPLAALALAGTEAPAAPPASAASAILTAVETLCERLNGDTVLVIDDADDLDAVSVGVITAAYARKPFPVLAVMRLARIHDETCRTLLAEIHPLVRVTLDPLPFDDLHRAVHDMLPGSVDPSAVAQIATLSGGMPKLLEAIVETGRRSGAIVEHDGVWRCRSDPWCEQLKPVIEPMLWDLSDDELAALTKLAEVDSTTLEEAKALVPPAMLARLSAAGMLQQEDTPQGRQIWVFPQLATEYLRHEIASTADAARTTRDPLDGYQLTMSRATWLNLRIREHWHAEVRTLREAWMAHPDAKHAVALILALNGIGADEAEFAEVFDGTDVAGSDPVWIARYISWHAAFLALVRGDAGAAHALLDEYEPKLPGLVSQLRAAAAILQVLAGVVPGDAAFQAAGDEDVLSVEGLSSIHRVAMAVAGRTDDALADLPQHAVSSYPTFTETYNVAIGLARVLGGEFDAGVRWALRAMAEAEPRLNPGEMQAHAYVAALGYAFAGRLGDLQALLGPALTLDNTTMLHRSYQVGLLEVSAAAARWSGLSHYSETLGTQAVNVGAVHDATRPTVRSPRLITDGSAEAGDASGDVLWRAVDDRFAKGHVASAVVLAAAAVEAAPDAKRAAAAAKWAAATQSRFLKALGAYITAVVADDPDALRACADAFRRSGARLHAVKAGVTLALALRRHGELEPSIRTAEAVWAEAQELGRPSGGLFVRLGEAVGLTAREREIAHRLADGSTAADVATALNLSTRTVENYLSSAYRKLGSEGHADLARAVATWAVG